jgi:hypothetical protein
VRKSWRRSEEAAAVRFTERARLWAAVLMATVVFIGVLVASGADARSAAPAGTFPAPVGSFPAVVGGSAAVIGQ